MFEKYRVIHFVGIGGIGMSGIAEVLHKEGYKVTGSDLKDSETTKRLSNLGIKVYIGHRAENIGDAHVVVVSSAVSDNIEVIEANRRSIPVISRAEMLAELGRLKYAILVAGAHGKTTTTSLISDILTHASFDPTVIIGGRLKATGCNAKLGRGKFLVAEADESDGSFLKLSPTIAVTTNIDREHMDFFKTMDSLKRAFLSFMNKVPFYGVSVLCIEDEYLCELLPSLNRRYITYGFRSEAVLSAINIKKGIMSVSFEVVYKGKNIGDFYLPLPGLHNVLNALAAIGVALELQVDIPKIKEALRGFGGIERRFELKGEVEGIKVFDDYAHHPTEIKATLRAAKEMFPGRLFAIFQPHRYTRTKDLMDEFSSSFNDADSVILLDIYSAGEKPLEGINTETLFERIKKAGHKDALYIKDKDAVTAHIVSNIKRGDVIFTLGAGDVWKIGEKILDKLKVKSERVIEENIFRFI